MSRFIGVESLPAAGSMLIIIPLCDGYGMPACPVGRLDFKVVG
ncbi:hypothetical protein [Lunatibacter salilacus]|nr:hypothetical protein [Lunatibacter salilacus]